MRFDLADGFPLVTTKKVHLKSIIYELLWFLRGDTNVRYLHEHDVTIWDEWADEQGELGPVYGYQWRSWTGRQPESIDQISNVIEQIRTNPDSRRLIVSAWNVADVPAMALPPCHLLFQFYVADGRLSCQLYQRSADVFLGVPFNIASYALLTMMFAQVTDLKPGEFVHTLGDAHLVRKSFGAGAAATCRENRARCPRCTSIPSVKSIFDFEYEQLSVGELRSASKNCRSDRGLAREGRMRISIIVAVAENGVIGRGGQLPWRLSADLQRFKQAHDGPHDHHGSANVGVDWAAIAGSRNGRCYAATRITASTLPTVTGRREH